MSEPSFDDWQKLESLAERLSQSGTSPGSIDAAEWATIDTRLNEAIQSQDHASVLRLRLMFGPLLARDSATGSDVLRKLEAAAIRAADALQETKLLADFLGASGHNLHRLGYHRESIEAFMEIWSRVGEQLGGDIPNYTDAKPLIQFSRIVPFD